MVQQAPKDKKKSNSVGESIFSFFLPFLTRLIKESRNAEKE